MKIKVKSPGSATIINAIASGSGSAYGIDLGIDVSAKLISEGIKTYSDIGADTSLMDLSVKKVLDHYDLNCGIEIKTKSNLPLGSGLSSSSALSNGVVKTCSKLIADEFNLDLLSDLEIINLAIDASLEANVTITGAFDDASASYFGGVTVTDNINRQLLIKEDFPQKTVLLFLVDCESETINSDINRMKLISPLVDLAFEQALNKNYYMALNLNGFLYGSVLAYDNNISIEALNAGALASGLSGTGSAFSAIVNDEDIDNVKDAWSSFDGKIIETKVNNSGCVFKY